MLLRSLAIPLFALSFTFVNPCDAPKKTGAGPTESDSIFDVTVIYPEFSQVPDRHTVAGLIDNSEVHHVTAVSDATIEQITVREGDNIDQNDPVFILSNTNLVEKIDLKRAKIKEYQARLREVQAKLSVSANEDQPANLDDTLFLDEDYEEGNLPKDYGDAGNPRPVPKTLKSLAEVLETTADSLTKEADALDRKLLALTQVSPVKGVVNKINFSEGNSVKEQDRVIEIITTDPLSVTFYLPDDVASFIDKGSEVTVSPLDAPDLTGVGQVYFINPQLETLKGGIEVKANFANNSDRIKAGQKAQVKITTRKQNNAIILNKKALHYEDGKAYVFIVFNDRAKLVAVRTGDEQDGKTQLFGDLRVDDPIIIERPEELKHNSFVKVANTR